MVVSKSSYEECRLKRLEENKKRMESLNLPQLSQSLRNSSATKFKPTPKKEVKPRAADGGPMVVRRSGRVSKLPTPLYKEVDYEGIMGPRRGNSRYPANMVFASAEERGYAFEKAEELQSSLDPQYPSFVKSMVPSHVSSCFWLGLPLKFCKTSLPQKDCPMTLVDDDGEEYETMYLAHKTGLSGGWRGFSLAHDLADGDALVFQVIKPSTMKVYIIRVNSFRGGKNSPKPGVFLMTRIDRMRFVLYT